MLVFVAYFAHALKTFFELYVVFGSNHPHTLDRIDCLYSIFPQSIFSVLFSTNCIFGLGISSAVRRQLKKIKIHVQVQFLSNSMECFILESTNEITHKQSEIGKEKGSSDRRCGTLCSR